MIEVSGDLEKNSRELLSWASPGLYQTSFLDLQGSA
jgi:hypothetical protein